MKNLILLSITVLCINISFSQTQADETAAKVTETIQTKVNDNVLILDTNSIQQDAIERLRKNVQNEVNKHPNLYDQKDVQAFLSDNTGLSALNFLKQRSFQGRRAFRLAVSTLRWRAKLGLNQLTSANFPCDLFKAGLIFEYGKTHSRSGKKDEGNPVIWVRLGALGTVVKHMEKITPKKTVSMLYNTARKAVRRSGRKEKRRYRAIVKDRTLRGDETIKVVLQAIAWWLEDWQKKHPNTQATLVLDFEDTDFAMSSWSMGDFFVKLDDHFPNMFNQIIGFRYKPKFWSIHSPISMFNRIFKSRVSSPKETDNKLKFVKSEPQISAYMPRVDDDGFTMLPQHVAGLCLGSKNEAPTGCLSNVDQLAANGLFDAQLFSSILDEFVQICKPQLKEVAHN